MWTNLGGQELCGICTQGPWEKLHITCSNGAIGILTHAHLRRYEVKCAVIVSNNFWKLLCNPWFLGSWRQQYLSFHSAQAWANKWWSSIVWSSWFDVNWSIFDYMFKDSTIYSNDTQKAQHCAKPHRWTTPTTTLLRVQLCNPPHYVEHCKQHPQQQHSKMVDSNVVVPFLLWEITAYRSHTQTLAVLLANSTYGHSGLKPAKKCLQGTQTTKRNAVSTSIKKNHGTDLVTKSGMLVNNKFVDANHLKQKENHYFDSSGTHLPAPRTWRSLWGTGTAILAAGEADVRDSGMGRRDAFMGRGRGEGKSE